MFKTIFLGLWVLCTSCTCNIVMNHTEGSASDLVDDIDTPTLEISPNITGIPSE